MFRLSSGLLAATKIMFAVWSAVRDRMGMELNGRILTNSILNIRQSGTQGRS